MYFLARVLIGSLEGRLLLFVVSFSLLSGWKEPKNMRRSSWSRRMYVSCLVSYSFELVVVLGEAVAWSSESGFEMVGVVSFW